MSGRFEKRPPVRADCLRFQVFQDQYSQFRDALQSLIIGKERLASSVQSRGNLEGIGRAEIITSAEFSSAFSNRWNRGKCR